MSSRGENGEPRPERRVTVVVLCAVPGQPLAFRIYLEDTCAGWRINWSCTIRLSSPLRMRRGLFVYDIVQIRRGDRMLKSKQAHIVRSVGLVLACVLVGYGMARVMPFPGRRSAPPPAAEANVVAELILEPRTPTEAGTVHGAFSVTARLVNSGQEDLRDLVVIADQVHALAGYSGVLPKSERKMQYIALLPAGKQVSLRFTGFETFHPEEKQEVIVSVLGHPGVRKTVYRAVFAPGSND